MYKIQYYLIAILKEPQNHFAMKTMVNVNAYPKLSDRNVTDVCLVTGTSIPDQDAKNAIVMLWGPMTQIAMTRLVNVVVRLALANCLARLVLKDIGGFHPEAA